MHIYIMIISHLIIVGFQKCETKEVIYKYNNENNNKVLFNNEGAKKIEPLANILNDNDYNKLRSASNVWNSIKTSAKNTWNYIKIVAKKTDQKIKLLIENVKTRSKKIRCEFNERVKEIHNKVKDLIEKALGTGELVKLCLQDQKEAIEDIVKKIIKDVTLCISENVFTATLLEKKSSVTLNESEFNKNLENTLDLCTKMGDVDEQCLYNAREHMLDKMSDKESEILNQRFESRNVADGILDAIVTCSTDGLLNASNNITLEAIEVIKCVKEHKANSTHYN